MGEWRGKCSVGLLEYWFWVSLWRREKMKTLDTNSKSRWDMPRSQVVLEWELGHRSEWTWGSPGEGEGPKIAPPSPHHLLAAPHPTSTDTTSAIFPFLNLWKGGAPSGEQAQKRQWIPSFVLLSPLPASISPSLLTTLHSTSCSPSPSHGERMDWGINIRREVSVVTLIVGKRMDLSGSTRAGPLALEPRQCSVAWEGLICGNCHIQPAPHSQRTTERTSKTTSKCAYTQVGGDRVGPLYWQGISSHVKGKAGITLRNVGSVAHILKA